MFRTVGDQPTLWEAILPDELRRLPVELARVDALLDDPQFFTPFVPFFDPRQGRPSTPMETYLRLMFLKFRYRLGFESLCREVSGSITWRQFCRIGLHENVPHQPTLMKLTTRCGFGGGRRAERGIVGESSGGEAAALHPGPGRHQSCRRTWPTRPTPGCSREQCGGSLRPGGGSRPPAAESGPESGTDPGPPGNGPMT